MATTAKQSISRRRIFVYAALFAVLSGSLVFYYLRQMEAKAADVLSPPKTGVVVARQDIAPRTRLGEEMLELVQLPVEARHPQAFGAVAEVAGLIVKDGLARGEPVLANHLVGSLYQLGLTSRIASQRRAVAINISEATAVAGMINPGDFVDVVAVFDVRVAGKDTAVTVLQNVEVLAVGNRLEADDGATATAKAVAKTVTLAVTPEDAQQLALAEERGKLHLSLRPLGEKSLVPLRGTPLDSLTSR